jgi:virulence-associated protein VagC
MTQSTVFTTNKSRAIRLPKFVSLPDSVRKVEIVKPGRARLVTMHKPSNILMTDNFRVRYASRLLFINNMLFDTKVPMTIELILVLDHSIQAHKLEFNEFFFGPVGRGKSITRIICDEGSYEAVRLERAGKPQSSGNKRFCL